MSLQRSLQNGKKLPDGFRSFASISRLQMGQRMSGFAICELQLAILLLLGWLGSGRGGGFSFGFGCFGFGGFGFAGVGFCSFRLGRIGLVAGVGLGFFLVGVRSVIGGVKAA